MHSWIFLWLPSQSQPPLAALTGKDWGHLIGFFVVITTLILLWALTALVGRYFSGQARRLAAREHAARQQAESSNKKPKTTAVMSQQSNPSTSAPSAGEIEPGVLAAISAAVHVALGGRQARIVSIQPQRSEWGRYGRLRVFSSHKMR